MLQTAAACQMVEDNKVDANSVDSSAVLKPIGQYAYAQKNTIGFNYAVMVVMTGWADDKVDNSYWGWSSTVFYDETFISTHVCV